MESSDLGTFTGFLETLLAKEYRFVSFSEASPSERHAVMRHDIDFDTGMALNAARIEADLNIPATYFFLLRSPFYNVFSGQDHENILAVRELGHTISIHFDPTLYTDFADGLANEKKVFEVLFGESVEMISLHRPNEFFLEHDSPISGTDHTYQTKYFRDLKYFSDSTGKWRFGNPLDSPEFEEGRALHILLHPIWWFSEGATNHDKLRTFYASRTRSLKEAMGMNCIPFREIEHEF